VRRIHTDSCRAIGGCATWVNAGVNRHVFVASLVIRPTKPHQATFVGIFLQQIVQQTVF
jgi:hypothetical protein